MKSSFKRIILTVLILLVLGLAGAYIILPRYIDSLRIKPSSYTRPTIDLNQYVTITTTGYEGYGHAKASINLDSLLLRDLQYVNQENISPDSLSATYYLANSLQVVLSTEEGLSNGDTIQYYVNRYNDCATVLDCDIIGGEGQITVNNLDPLTDYDPFENLEVVFEGISPCITASLIDGNTFSKNQAPAFTIEENSTNLKNDNTITINFKNDVEKMKEVYGYNITSTQKEYTVENMPAYVSSYDELTQDDIQMILADVASIISEDLVANNIYGNQVPQLVYSGYIFAETQDYAKAFHKNELCIFYKTNVLHDGEDVSIYYPILLTNIYKHGNQLVYDIESHIAFFNHESNLNNGFTNPYVYCYQFTNYRPVFHYTYGDEIEDYPEYLEENRESLESSFFVPEATDTEEDN